MLNENCSNKLVILPILRYIFLKQLFQIFQSVYEIVTNKLFDRAVKKFEFEEQNVILRPVNNLPKPKSPNPNFQPPFSYLAADRKG